jgi:hypothetical protein
MSTSKTGIEILLFIGGWVTYPFKKVIRKKQKEYYLFIIFPIELKV